MNKGQLDQYTETQDLFGKYVSKKDKKDEENYLKGEEKCKLSEFIGLRTKFTYIKKTESD